MDLSFLGQMAWKSALISGAALALAAALRARPPADRAAVLRAGVLLLLLLPVVALSLPALRLEVWGAIETSSPPYPGRTGTGFPTLTPSGLEAAAPVHAEQTLSPFPDPGRTDAAHTAPSAVDPRPVEPTLLSNPTLLVVFGYLIGLMAFAARLLAGVWTLRRWTTSARPVSCPEWLAAFDRARANTPRGKKLRLLVCDSVPSPLSWGWLRPAILIDTDTLHRPDGAEAILGHEVAHVVHRDWPVLILSRLVTALFWFNPLVWLLEREVVQQAEQAADRKATELVEPARYAQTLLNWAQAHGAAVPAHGIAPSAPALARRISAVLDERLRERPASSAWTACSILICIGFAAPVAALELVSKVALVVEGKAASIAPAGSFASTAPSRVSGPDKEALTFVAVDTLHATVQPQSLSKAASEAVTVGVSGDQPDMVRALETAHHETLAAAERRYQSKLAALQAEHTNAIAVARRRYQSNLAALEANRTEAIEVANRERWSDQEAYQTKYTHAIEVFQNGYQTNTEAFQSAYTQATETFQNGYQENTEAFQNTYTEATEAFQSAYVQAL